MYYRHNAAPKRLRRQQIARRLEQAIKFAREVLGNEELAAELEALTLEQYAARRGFEIMPEEGGEHAMAKPLTNEPESEVDVDDRILDVLEDIRDSVDDLISDLEEEEEEEEED